MFLLLLIVFFLGNIFLGVYLKGNFVKYILFFMISSGLIISSINVGIELGSVLTKNNYSISLSGIVYELNKSLKKDDMEELRKKIILITTNLQCSAFSCQDLRKIEILLDEAFSSEDLELRKDVFSFDNIEGGIRLESAEGVFTPMIIKSK